MRKERKIIAGLLAAIIMTASVSVTMPKVEAADKGSAVEVKTTIEYVDMTESFASDFGKQDQIPTKEGYLFGGWYKDQEGTTVIKEASQVAEGEKVYAKFVPTHVLSVKAQIYADTARTADDSGKTNVRLVTSLDCKKYKNAGFEIIDMSGETERVIKSDPMDTVYSALRVKKDNGETQDYTAQDIFGTLNESEQRLVVLTLNKIPETKWDSDIYVRPYWTTLDGVKVYGLGKYVYVNDGLDGWISVPINLNTGDAVAAGMLSVDFPSGLEYQECRAGVLFENVDAMATGNTVNCVGNVSELENIKAEDMYITLRFKVTDETYEVGKGEFLDFTVNNIDFCDIGETTVPMKILNVRY